MAREVLGVVLALAVLEVRRLHEDAGAVCPSPLAVGACVRHPHRDRVSDLTRARRTTVTAHAGDDHRTVAELEL